MKAIMCINKLHHVYEAFVRIVLGVFTECLRENIEKEVSYDDVCPHCLKLERDSKNKSDEQ